MKFCDLSVQWRAIEDEVKPKLEKLLSGGKYILGEAVEQFEQEFAEFCETKYCIGVANGTDALVIALKGLSYYKGWPDGNHGQTKWKAITTPLTFIATANAIKRAGGDIRLADVKEDGNIDPSRVLDSVKAARYGDVECHVVVPVHLYGAPIPRTEMASWEFQHRLSTVEDCAQAHGAVTYYSQAGRSGARTGSYGDAGCFSFFPTKPLGCCGDGGAVVTSSKGLYDIMLALRSQGGKDKNNVKYLGLNSRLDALQAVILSAKLKQLPEWQKQRAKLAIHYNELIKEAKAYKKGYVYLVNSEAGGHAYHLYVIGVTVDRDQLRAHLSERSIPTVIHYPKLIHEQPLYWNQFHGGHESWQQRFPVAEKLVNDIVSLPFYPGMPLSDAEQVVQAIDGFYDKHAKS